MYKISFSRLFCLFIPAYKPNYLDVKKECDSTKISSKREFTGDRDKQYADGQQKCKELCTSDPTCRYYVYEHNNRCSLFTGCDKLRDTSNAVNIYEKIGKSIHVMLIYIYIYIKKM